MSGGEESRGPLTRHLPSRPQAASGTPVALAPGIREAGLALGLARVGFAPTSRLEEDGARLETWLRRGRQGTLRYLEGPADRADPRALHPEARTAIVAALTYDGAGAGSSTVARYARGEDYHLVLKAKLSRLADQCAEIAGCVVTARICVDTAPILERALAVRAGMAFAGKSTLAIIPGLGTYFVLGVLLVDLALPAAEPMASRCGACTACLDACPTGAFAGEWDLDAARCIAYLTIESTAPIPRPLREPLGVRAFGCDVCQEVCPYNAREASAHPAALTPRDDLRSLDPAQLVSLGSAQHRRLVRRTALRRTSRATLARSACVALGNSGDPAATAPLAAALAGDDRPTVRAHAAWALGRLGGAAAESALAAASAEDPDETVRGEARAALQRLGSRA